ncbi:MAG: P-II family nitrogen regulator [Deltaproteobacteria bacterium]|nr:P-II family nitrogen regulator [Deltaproteobacteria bacterium]
MKAYVRIDRAAHVVETLQRARVPGLTAYVVHGISGETLPSYHGLCPFEPSTLHGSVKTEVVCEQGLVDGIIGTVAAAAKTGYPGDGIINVEDVEKMVRIREVT